MAVHPHPAQTLPAFSGDSPREFVREQTHCIALWPDHRLIADSSGSGWREVYTSLATEQPWGRTLHALPHVALAYCVNRPALVRRAIDGEGAAVQAELRPRTFGVVPSDRDSHWLLKGSPDIQLIYLHRELINRVAGEAFGLTPSEAQLTNGLAFADPMLEQLAITLLDAAREPGGGAGSALFADSVAHLMAMHLLRRYSARPGSGRAASDRPAVSERRLRHVCDFIDSALHEDLSIPRLAAEAGLSAHAFGPAFTRATGSTPHSYVLRRRIERAKQLLRDSELPVLQVALQTGFASQSHLSTAFKRATGSTPGAYRR